MSEPLLSLSMIVRDEREVLPRCLTSAAPFVDEIVVVDTGSADGTPELAARHGARVLHETWRDDFSRARNIALGAARGRWVLVLDADEWIEEGVRPEALRDSLAAGGAEALTVEVADRLDGGAEGRYRLVRLFRNRERYRYEGAFHEQITPAIARALGVPAVAAPPSGLVVGHDGYLAERRAERGKAERNLAFLRRRVRTDPQDAAGRYFLARERVPMRGGRAVPGRHLDEALRELDWIDAHPGALSEALDADAALRHAAVLLARGRPRQALDILERRGGDGVAAELLRADAEVALAREVPSLERALGRIERCFDRPPAGRATGPPLADPALPGALARARSAEVLARLGRLDAASARAAEATRLPGGGAAPWNARARVARARGSLTEALRGYARAVALDPRDPDAWFGIGSVLLEAGRPRDAIEPLEKAVRLAPGWKEAEVALAAAREEPRR